MNIKEAKEALEKHQATHGDRYHIFIAPMDMKNWPSAWERVVDEQRPMPEELISSRTDLDVVFVERSNIDHVRNNGGPYFTKYLRLGAPEV